VEDFYSIVLDERFVLATPCNSGYPMQRHLVTSLAGPRTGAKASSRGKMRGVGSQSRENQ
jgi:hypothetical protein